MPSFIVASLLLLLSVGCKGKKDLPENAGHADVPVETHAPAVEPVEPTSTETGEQAADSVYFMIERTACYGTCPAYRLTILQDGSATYEGRRFAEREGRFTGQVDAATMAALRELATEKDIYRMDDLYDKPVTDLPSLIVRIHADHRDKKVIGRVGAPQAFKDLGLQAEKLLANIEWTKVGDLR